MATKPAAKKTPARKTPVRKIPEASEPKYFMPQEVKEWIEQASSRLKHLQGEVDRLKEENRQLKAYKRFAESRILRSEHE